MLQIVRPSCLLCHPLLIYRDLEESQSFRIYTAGVCKHTQKVSDKRLQGIESNTRITHIPDPEVIITVSSVGLDRHCNLNYTYSSVCSKDSHTRRWSRAILKGVRSAFQHIGRGVYVGPSSAALFPLRSLNRLRGLNP